MASTSRRKAATAVLIWKIPAATACDGLFDDDDGDDRDPFCRSWKLIFFLCFLFCFFGFQKKSKIKKNCKWEEQSPTYVITKPNNNNNNNKEAESLGKSTKKTKGKGYRNYKNKVDKLN